MIIRDENNFLSIIKRMLEALGYEKVEEHTGKVYDLSAVKDNEKYCFKCRYDIDAISEQKMQALVDGTKDQNFDKVVFVTNSSFISSAKKLGEKEGVILWDRNTIDRMLIGVKEDITEEVFEEKRSFKGAVVAIIAVVLIGLAGFAYYYFFR